MQAMQSIDVSLWQVSKIFGNPRRGDLVHAVDDVSLDIQRGEFFALLGPSGCGKTTTLRMIAGFEHPTSGELMIEGKPMRGVPSFHRPVNTVFQEYALFPHMNVMQNVAFGLKTEHLSRREIQTRVRDILELVQLGQAGDRKPHQLSGGQQQRVALARALVKRPSVLLLDEPLGALDLKLRKAMQYELKQMQLNLGITFIYVTHDQEEALVMADRIAVMDQGKVLQVGTPGDIYEAPNHRFVADFIGETNFLTGELLETTAEDAAWVRLTTGETVSAQLPNAQIPTNGQVTIAVRPEKLTLLPAQGPVQDDMLGRETQVDVIVAAAEHEPDSNLVPGKLIDSAFVGTDTRHVVEIGQNGARINMVIRTPNRDYRGATGFAKGQPVYVYWKGHNTRVLVD